MVAQRDNVKRETSRRYYLEHLAVLLVVAGLCIVLLHTGAWMSLSRYFYDNMLKLLPEPTVADITIVTIDEPSLQEIGRWPWDRSVHAQLVRALDDLGARAIVLDLIFSEPDRVRPESDAALVAAMARHGSVFLPVHVSEGDGGANLKEVMPHSSFARAAAGMGHVDVELDEDGVVRGLYMRSGVGQPWWPHLSLALLDHEDPRALPLYPARQAYAARSGVVRQYYRMVPFSQKGEGFRRVSVLDVLYGRAAASDIKDKIVFVGASAQGLGDVLPTPLSGRRGLLPGVELNASVFAALREHRLLRPLPTPWVWGLSLALALITPTVLPFVAPRWSIPVVGGAVLGVLLFSYTMLYWRQLWFPVGPAMIGALMAYPLWTWRRLEYSIGYMRAALERQSLHDDLNQRLVQQARLDDFLVWLEQVMPVTAWRIRPAVPGVPNRLARSEGGAAVPERSWQGTRGRHYSMIHDHQRYELSLVWNEGAPTPAQEQWVRAMIARSDALPDHADNHYDVVESHIERMAAQEVQQQALTRFFEASLEQLRDGIAIADACGCLLFLNTQAQEWLGLTQRRVAQLSLLDIGRELVLSEDFNWRAILCDALSSGRAQLECRSRGGLDLYVDVLRIRAGQHPGEVLIVTLKDISEVKNAIRARGEMMDFLSHDLRSPMVSLLALAEQSRKAPLEPGQFLEQTEYYARRSLNFAEQFLQLARAESVQQEDFVLLDMLPVVESAIEQVNAQAVQRQIRVKFEYDLAEEVWVNGNHELLERGMVNLLTNAVKYSGAGRDVSVKLYCAGQRVHCRVQDHGVGIEPDFLQHLFKAYSRARSAGGARTRGAGLGLRFVKVVAERHGGEVQVSSVLGEGSVFTLSLPRTALS